MSMLAEDHTVRSVPADGGQREKLQSLLDDKYVLLRELGAGSAGTVYEAEHVLVGKRVAIKLMHRTFASDEVARARFFDEARAAARIAHANVVDIYDLGMTHDGTPYLVMELLRGETLEEVVRGRGALSPAYACELVLNALAGLGAAHALGIVHRDLKPANIVVTHPRPERPLVKVLDFGIAKGVTPFGKTNEDGVLGTPTYMAPEQASGRAADARSDLYSAAVILYELIAGEPPFQGEGIREILSQVVRGAARPLHALNPAVPRPLCHAIARAMALDPNERFQSAAEFAQHLWAYAAGAPIAIASSSSGHPIPLMAGDFAGPVVVLSSSPGVRPRDFPSLGLVNVQGKPNGLPVSDSLLARPVIPRAPAAPKISLPVDHFPNIGPSYAPALAAVALPSLPLPASAAPEKAEAPAAPAEKPVEGRWRTTVMALLAGVVTGGGLALLLH